jgi:hypothetical protein
MVTLSRSLCMQHGTAVSVIFEVFSALTHRKSCEPRRARLRDGAEHRLYVGMVLPDLSIVVIAVL